MLHLLRLVEIEKKFIQASSVVTVFNHISAQFIQGNSYAITGISGSGKSTLIHLLAALDSPSAGQIFFDQSNLLALPAQERALFLNSHIGLVFQQPYLIAELSVVENVMVPGLIARKEWQFCAARAQDLLALVGLAEKKDEKPGALSGGQQQRVALARALFNQPTFLLADEPTGNLDLKTGIAIIELITKLQKEWAMGLIISTHDDYVAQRMQHAYVIENSMLIQIR